MLQLVHHVAAPLKVVLMDDDGVHWPNRQQQFRTLTTVPHQQAIAGTACWRQGVRTILKVMAYEQ